MDAHRRGSVGGSRPAPEAALRGSGATNATQAALGPQCLLPLRARAGAGVSWPGVHEQLDSIACLKDDWDGFGAEAPTPGLVRAAAEFALSMNGAGLDVPDRVLPAPDGTILFEWHGGGYRDAEVVSESRVEWMEERDGGNSHWVTDLNGRRLSPPPTDPEVPA